MRIVIAVPLLAAVLCAQETPTERDAARGVLAKMDALEKSVEVNKWVTRFSAPNADRDKVTARAKQLMVSELLAMGDDLTRHPEIGFQETRSVGILVEYLKRHHFEVTVGVANLPTAFVARFGKGAPSLGIILEYDALRGTRGRISMATSTARRARSGSPPLSLWRNGWSARTPPAASSYSAVRAKR